MKLIKILSYWVPILFILLAAYPFLPISSAIRGEQITVILIYALLGLGLNVVIGYTGLLHLGIAAYFAIGAYTLSILTAKLYPIQLSVLPAIIIATTAASLVGVITTAPTLRLRGDYLALVTLGFGLITLYAIRNLGNITQGTSGIILVDPQALPFVDISDSFQNSGKPLVTGWGKNWYNFPYFFFVVLTVLGAVMVILRNIERSRLGRAWVALREDELAATCMGLNPARLKLAAIALGGGLAGLAGALYAVALRTTGNPQTFDFTLSMIMVCCLILGGLGSRSGVLLGVGLLLGFDRIGTGLLDNWIQEHISSGGKSYMKVSGWRLIIFGLSLILMMRFRPEGLLPSERVKHELHPDSMS